MFTKEKKRNNSTVNEDIALEYKCVEVIRNNLKKDEKGNLIVTFDELRVKKPRVLITPAQAEILNTGRLIEQANLRFEIYLLPSENAPYLIHEQGKEWKIVKQKII